MAGGTGNASAIAMIKWESMLEAGGLPAFGGMTSRAIGSVFAVVIVIFSVTGITIFGRTGKFIIDMTLVACRVDMRAS